MCISVSCWVSDSGDLFIQSRYPKLLSRDHCFRTRVEVMMLTHPVGVIISPDEVAFGKSDQGFWEPCQPRTTCERDGLQVTLNFWPQRFHFEKNPVVMNMGDL